MSSSDYVSTKDLHDDEFKVRFTEVDGQYLRSLARKLGMPPAVLIRSIVKKDISASSAHIKQLMHAS